MKSWITMAAMAVGTSVMAQTPNLSDMEDSVNSGVSLAYTLGKAVLVIIGLIGFGNGAYQIFFNQNGATKHYISLIVGAIVIVVGLTLFATPEAVSAN